MEVNEKCNAESKRGVSISLKSEQSWYQFLGFTKELKNVLLNGYALNLFLYCLPALQDLGV